jgi:hypothetical protein
MRCRFTLLELVEREVWFEEWVEDESFCTVILDLCAAASCARYFEFLRYEGMKN